MALEVMKNFTEDRLEYYRYEQELKQRRVNEWQDASVQRRLDEANRARDKERRTKERERQKKESAPPK